VTEKAALEQYLWQNRERFYRIAYSYVGNEAEALDVVSDAIVKALEKGDSLKDRNAMATWAYRILVHAATDSLRKNKRVVYLDDVRQQDPGQPDVYLNLDLMAALRRLPDAQRIVVVLHFLEQMTLDETAAALGEHLSTVKSRLYKALKILRLDLSGAQVLSRGDTAHG